MEFELSFCEKKQSHWNYDVESQAWNRVRIRVIFQKCPMVGFLAALCTYLALLKAWFSVKAWLPHLLLLRSSLLSIPQTDISLFIQLTRRTI